MDAISMATLAASLLTQWLPPRPEPFFPLRSHGLLGALRPPPHKPLLERGISYRWGWGRCLLLPAAEATQGGLLPTFPGEGPRPREASVPDTTGRPARTATSVSLAGAWALAGGGQVPAARPFPGFTGCWRALQPPTSFRSQQSYSPHIPKLLPPPLAPFCSCTLTQKGRVLL